MKLEINGHKFEYKKNNKEILKAYINAYLERYYIDFNPISQIVFKKFENETFYFKAGSFGGTKDYLDMPTIETYVFNLRNDVFHFCNLLASNFKKTKNEIIISNELKPDESKYYWYEAEMKITILKE